MMRMMVALTAVWLGLLLFSCSHYGGYNPAEDGQTDAGFDAGGKDADGSTPGDDGAIKPDAGQDGGDCCPSDAGGCVVKDPLPMQIQIQGLGTDETLQGTAQVIFKGVTNQMFSWEIWLFLEESRRVVKLLGNLAEGYEIPVTVGEVLSAQLRMDTPWWTDIWITLGEQHGMQRFSYVDATNYQEPPPPSRCPPSEGFCGQLIYPWEQHATPDGQTLQLEQGDRALVLAADGAPVKLLLGRIEHYLRMDCDDVPESWRQAAELNNQFVSQCRCLDSNDCAIGQVCDTYVGRCVNNACASVRCADGFVCDPFRGECYEAPRTPCGSNADCQAFEICNPQTGRCQQDVCQVMDCFGQCSSLLGRCYGCLADCDCGLAVCDRANTLCVPGCEDGKVHLTQDNPQAFELAYLCIDPTLPAPQELFALYEQGISCGLTAPINLCDASAAVCNLALRYEGTSRRIEESQWTALCALSRNPMVWGIAGGYYLP